MNDIDPQMLLDVLDEVQAEKGYPEKYSVHISDVFARLAAKGYKPHDDAPAIPPDPAGVLAGPGCPVVLGDCPPSPRHPQQP